MQQSQAWFAVHSKTGSESNVMQSLTNKGADVLLPTYTIGRKWSDRTKVLHKVLFPGYLFVRINPDHRLPILTTPGVYSIVGIGKAPMAIPDEEIDTIRKIVESKFPLQPWPYLKVGQRVRIDWGPLKGLEGLLVQIKKSFRVVVSVDLVERSVAVEVSPDMLTSCSSWTKAPTQPIV